MKEVRRHERTLFARVSLFRLYTYLSPNSISPEITTFSIAIKEKGHFKPAAKQEYFCCGNNSQKKSAWRNSFEEIICLLKLQATELLQKRGDEHIYIITLLILITNIKVSDNKNYY